MEAAAGDDAAAAGRAVFCEDEMERCGVRGEGCSGCSRALSSVQAVLPAVSYASQLAVLDIVTGPPSL